jgi:hypothetical protein
MGYAIRITSRAVDVVSGADQTPGIVAAEASGAKVGLRNKWGGGMLRARASEGRIGQQGHGWMRDDLSSPYASYVNTPATAAFCSPGANSLGVPSPSPFSPSSVPSSSANPGLGFGSHIVHPPSPALRSPGPSPRPSTSNDSQGPPYHSASPLPTSSTHSFAPVTLSPTPPRRVSGPKKDD